MKEIEHIYFTYTHENLCDWINIQEEQSKFFVQNQASLSLTYKNRPACILTRKESRKRKYNEAVSKLLKRCITAALRVSIVSAILLIEKLMGK